MSKPWVLFCKLSGYFMEWTGIGPACTRKLAKAARFTTKREAMASPAFSFSLTCFEPKKVP